MKDIPEITTLDIHDLAAELASGRLTALALVETLIDRITRHNATYNAFIHVDAEGARAAASASDQRRANGQSLGLLDGMVFAVKDTFDVAGMPSTSGSARHAGRVAVETAPSLQRLISAGAICLGKLNTWEYGTGNGGISYDLANPPALNPRNITRFAAGSSTGSGAAVAAGFVVFAVGSDTGGSVRLPAASCGVVGLKPPNDLIPTKGMMPNSRSLDVPGPLARSPRDAALLVATMAGRPHAPAQKGTLKIGMPELGSEVDHRILEGLERSVDLLRTLGYSVEACALPLPLGHYRRITGVVNNGECAREHPDLADDPRIGTALREKLWRGLEISDESLARAQSGMAHIRALTDAVFDAFDLLLLPVTTLLAPDISDPVATRKFTRDAYTHPFNLSGHPAMAVPIGPTDMGLVLSVQLVARDIATIEGAATALATAFPTPATNLDFPYDQPRSRQDMMEEAASAQAGMAELLAELDLAREPS